MENNKPSRAEIIREIAHAFADTIYPGDDRLVINSSHYESDDVIQDFTGRHWNEITLEIAYKHRLSLPLFAPEAFLFYLPGLITTALQASDESELNPDEILEFIFYSLVPFKNELDNKIKLFEIVSGFTIQQKASIAKFISFFVVNSSYHKEIYGDRIKELWNI